MQSAQTEQLLTVQELARVLNVKTSWVYGKVSSKEIPHLHVGRYPRFVMADVIAWLRKQNGVA